MRVEFVDTNLLVYAFDLGARQRHLRAKEIVGTLELERRGAISMQVLIEFYAVATKKLSFDPAEARTTLASFGKWEIHVPTAADLIQSSLIQQQHQLSWWDALIVNSAQQLNASILWTEDLNHNQRIGNLTIKNPFLD
jgi:predicted nucleic acid-binding protein